MLSRLDGQPVWQERTRSFATHGALADVGLGYAISAIRSSRTGTASYSCGSRVVFVREFDGVPHASTETASGDARRYRHRLLSEDFPYVICVSKWQSKQRYESAGSFDVMKVELEKKDCG